MYRISLEIFPPKVNEDIQNFNKIKEVLSLYKDRIEYVSVTYHKGDNKATLDIASQLLEIGIRPLVHYTIAGKLREDLVDFVYECERRGIYDLLVLGGDSKLPQGDFKYASDAIAFLKMFKRINVFAAGYPEGHFSTDLLNSLGFDNLKYALGASLITQVCYDTESILNYVEDKELDKLHIGLMPIISTKTFKNIVLMSGCSLPLQYSRHVAKNKDLDIALFEGGMNLLLNQVSELAHKGIEHFHFYVMNDLKLISMILEII